MLRGAIVPVPAAPLRHAARGFDPAGELALALAGATGLPTTDALRRRDLGHQRGRSRSRRLRRPPAVLVAGRVPSEALLIDDVTTTGATLSACDAALRGAGCGWVGAVTLAAVRGEAQGLPAGTGRA